jgi:hypothetical protein
MSQSQDGVNQSITRMNAKKSSDNDDTIFYQGSLACRQASPRRGDSLT